VWDGVVGSRGADLINEQGGLIGPFNAFVHAPEVGRRLSSLGGTLRFGTSIERRLSEVAIITVGARWKAEFEWWAHSRMAREHGVPAAVIDAIGQGEEPPFESEDERTVYAVARELTEGGRLAGIITERDVLRAVALGANPDQSSVDEVMTAEVFTVHPDTQLQEAARHMAARWIRHLPVMDGDEIVGVVSMRDVTGVFAAMAPGSVEVEHEFDLLVRQRRLARIEHGDLD